MKTVWKFPLHTFPHTVMLPKGAEIVSVGMHQEQLMMWAAVDPDADMTTRSMTVVATGHPLPDCPSRFLGTVRDGQFIWHVFETFFEASQ